MEGLLTLGAAILQCAPAGSEASSNTTVQPLKDTISAQEKEIESLKQKLEAMEARSVQEVRTMLLFPCTEVTNIENHHSKKASEFNQKIGALNQTIDDLKSTISKQAEQYDTLQRDQEDLLVLLTDLDNKKIAMRKRLRELGDEIPSSDDDDSDDEEDTK